ncbi:MAG: protein translocase subunit SecF [candidate division Zixibacteria bacterium]|nr:protein translocase subunit SecF [candidate division Zixibacteria bacterium]MDH3935707.1 protein translocase subunit SecF [candidate division Zixibacteria bacterium]MDH4034882.1 protein translocase subunit SecF [candidate division Zixibacteria bacterium]
MFRIVSDTKIDFIGVRKYAFVISLALVALGIFALSMVITGKANLGIDFAGGTMIIGTFENEVAIDDMRSAISADFPAAMITQLSDFEEPNAFIVKVKRPESEAEGRDRSARLKEIIGTNFEGNTFTIQSEHIIGPAVGETLRNDAQKAVLLSLFCIVVYIWVRFDFRSGIAATIATFHDVLAVLGITYLLNIEFDLLLITALLTLAGYSLTDTVVVYDRIRENLKKFRSKGEFAASVNASINEVLSRTVNTSLTTLLVVGTLFFLGGEVLRTFALALILGVIVGTYSSVFVASPIVVEWEARSPKRFKR